MIYQAAWDVIEEKRSELFALADAIWEHPEVGYQEVFASQQIAEFLQKEGFQVERGCFGVPTALRASYGTGAPVIGYLAEYDALPGLSQKKSCHKEAVIPGAAGHGCGHALMPSANLLALLGAKAEMDKRGLKGTIVFYGCPAEEILTGKGLMAKNGAFKELDLALAWHPGKYNRASYSLLTGVHGKKYHFHGVTAHAAVEPEKGRSALDAAELMNVGINYLREHVPSDVRMHYVFSDGGQAPNIVPDHASVWYFDRALDIRTMETVEERMLDVAKGAAMMTGTRLEVEDLGGCYPVLPNHELADLIDWCMREIPQESWTKEENEFAARINEADHKTWKESVAYAHTEKEDMQIYEGVMPIDTDHDYGSSDVGDVSHIVPATFFKTACYPIGAPGHSWQIAASLMSSIGEKGMVYASKILAAASLKMMENPKICQKAKVEFLDSMKGQRYKSLIPDSFQIPGK